MRPEGALADRPGSGDAVPTTVHAVVGDGAEPGEGGAGGDTGRERIPGGLQAGLSVTDQARRATVAPLHERRVPRRGARLPATICGGARVRCGRGQCERQRDRSHDRAHAAHA